MEAVVGDKGKTRMKTPLELLRRVDGQAQGGHLRQDLRDDDMMRVYLSVALLREIAAVCNQQPPAAVTAEAETKEG